MKESIVTKLAALVDRHEEVAALLADPGTIAEQDRFRDLSREYARLEPVVREYRAWRAARSELQAAEEMASDRDPELRSLAEEEREQVEGRLQQLELALQKHLVPRDPLDDI